MSKLYKKRRSRLCRNPRGKGRSEFLRKRKKKVKQFMGKGIDM